MGNFRCKFLSIKRKEVIRFLIGGGSAVTIDYLLYQVFLNIGIVRVIAKAVSFFCGAVVGFIINKHWTFESHGFKKEEIGKYVLFYSFSACINAMIHQIVLFFLGREGMAFLCATGSSTILNFFGQKFYVFRRGSE